MAGRPRRFWVRPHFTRVDVAISLGVMSLLVGGFLVVDDDLRAHVLGQTEPRMTRVVHAEQTTTDDGDLVGVYRVSWSDDEGSHLSEYKRSGPVRHEAGDRLDLWVAAGVGTAEDESPTTVRLLFFLGVPLLGLLAAWLRAWVSAVRHRAIELGGG